MPTKKADKSVELREHPTVNTFLAMLGACASECTLLRLFKLKFAIFRKIPVTHTELGYLTDQKLLALISKTKENDKKPIDYYGICCSRSPN